MNFEPIELLAAVRHRLHPERLEVDRERHGPTVVATMPRDVRICKPGLQQLTPWDGGADTARIIGAGRGGHSTPIRRTDCTSSARRSSGRSLWCMRSRRPT
jgi:hypothetical protein